MSRAALLALALLASGADLNLPPSEPPARAHVGPRAEVCPGATHFYADWMRKPPRWAAHMRVVCHIGHHIFLAPRRHHPKQRSTS